MYLFIADYYTYIQPEQFDKLISGNDAIRILAERAGQAEAVSYLTQRYNVAEEFTDTSVWSNTESTYTAESRVYLDAPDFDATESYTNGDLVNYEDIIYRCTSSHSGTWDAANFTMIGLQYTLYYGKLPQPLFDYYKKYDAGDIVFYAGKEYTAQAQVENVFPNDPEKGAQFWGSGTTYSIPATTLPTDANYWVIGDNRSQQVVQCMIDIVLFHLHTRIAPGNVPQSRTERYVNAKEWLRMAGGQIDGITADIPLMQPKAGQRTRYGGNLKRNNLY